MKVFLTGATGLLGYNIVNELLENGYDVTALVRSREKGTGILPPSVKMIQGDLQDTAGFAHSLKGMDLLIHAGACYGEYYRTGKTDTLTAVNVNGTRNLLKTAYEQAIRSAVFISSAAVLKTEVNGVVDETAPYTDDEDPYFKSKIEAEKEVYRFLGSHRDMRIVLLLPAVMLGPGDRGPTPNGNFVLNYLKENYKFIIPGSNRIADARDVAETAVSVIKRGKSGERYIIGGKHYPYSEILKTLAKITGREELKKTISAKKLLIMATILSLISKIKGKPSELKPVIVKRLQKNFRYNSEKAERELGVSFRPLEETLSDTVTWFMNNSYVK